MADVIRHRWARITAVLGVPVGALLVATVVVGNWWSAVALVGTVIREHRAAFEQRLERARRTASRRS